MKTQRKGRRKTMKKQMLITTLFSLPFLMVMAIFISPCAGEESGGIGLAVAQLYEPTRQDHRGRIVVLDVFANKPAQKSGIHRGDIITHIDGVRTLGKDFSDLLLNKLRGESGTELNLTIWRTNESKRLKVIMTRDSMVY
jgi:C-terminal processing protease CtpA/Prc